MPVWGKYDALIWRSFPTRAERVADGRYFSSDIGKVGFQADEKTYWRLVGVTNPGFNATPRWEQMPSAELPGVSVAAASVIVDNVTTLRLQGASVTDLTNGSVLVTLTGSGGGTIDTVRHISGLPTITAPTILEFDGATVTEPVPGTARIQVTGGGGLESVVGISPPATVSGVQVIEFDGATVTEPVPGTARVEIQESGVTTVSGTPASVFNATTIIVNGNATVTEPSPGVAEINVGNGATNLSYENAPGEGGWVRSDTGNDALIPLASAEPALNGLITPEEKAVIASVTGHPPLIAGVGVSGTLGHVRVDGSSVTINPSTGVISAVGSSGGGASSDSGNFLFIRSSVGIMNRTGLSWFGQTSGPNTTTETVSGNDWIRLRMPVVSGGGDHFSVRWWSAPGGDKVITARIMGTTALPGSPCRFAIAARNPGGAQYTFGYDGVSGQEQLLLQRWNSAWGGPSEIYGYRIIHRWIDRWRMVITGTTIVAQYWIFGVWMDLGEMTHSEVSSIAEVGLMIQRVGNVDTILYCDEFQVTT